MRRLPSQAEGIETEIHHDWMAVDADKGHGHNRTSCYGKVPPRQSKML